MSKRLMLREPQKIDAHNWYYEYPSYLLLVHEVRRADGTYVETDFVKLYWRKIGASMKRSYRSRKRRS
jgi:hypothetical protein